MLQNIDYTHILGRQVETLTGLRKLMWNRKVKWLQHSIKEQRVKTFLNFFDQQKYKL